MHKIFCLITLIVSTAFFLTFFMAFFSTTLASCSTPTYPQCLRTVLLFSEVISVWPDHNHLPASLTIEIGSCHLVLLNIKYRYEVELLDFNDTCLMLNTFTLMWSSGNWCQKISLATGLDVKQNQMSWPNTFLAKT